MRSCTFQISEESQFPKGSSESAEYDSDNDNDIGNENHLPARLDGPCPATCPVYRPISTLSHSSCPIFPTYRIARVVFFPE